MLAQAQAVDDRDLGLCGELLHHLVRSRPHDDPVDEPLEVARDVADALARAEDDVVGQVDRVPTELDHPGLERHPRAQARLLEEHRERPARQRPIGVPPLARYSALSDAVVAKTRPTSAADRSATLSRSRPRRERRHPGATSASCTAAPCALA